MNNPDYLEGFRKDWHLMEQCWTEMKWIKDGPTLRKLIVDQLSCDFPRNAKHSWKVFADDIWSFCLAAGCPKADRHDPFACVEALRDLVSRQFMYTADLHNKISELNGQIIIQQRMITALAYRDIIENLSATIPGPTATAKWHGFLESVFHGVENTGFPNDHPFARRDIGQRYPLHRLKEMAKELYSTFSRTIHNFQPSKDFDQYTPMPGQFDPMQIDFMTAMRPLREHLDDEGGPNWERERERYGIRTAHSKRTPKSEQGNTKHDTPGGNIIWNHFEPDLEDLDSEQRAQPSEAGGFTFGDDTE
ncbi:hypothetical protein F4818DRAFT_446829 [Hypoxylon cercidicola]|nr:hypothetical protein F4818DRAFT_446829 [Hypoxylon cercidicola]